MIRLSARRLGIAVLCGLLGLAVNLAVRQRCCAAAPRPGRHAAGRHPVRAVASARLQRCSAAAPLVPFGARRRCALLRRSKRVLIGVFARARTLAAARRRARLDCGRAALVAVPSLYGVGYLRQTHSAGRAADRRSAAWSPSSSPICSTSCGERVRASPCRPRSARERRQLRGVRLSRLRARRDAAGAAAGGGRRPADRRPSRKPTAARGCTKRSPRSASTSATTSATTRTRCSRWRPRSARRPARRRGDGSSCSTELPQRLSGLHHALRRRPRRHRCARSSRRATRRRRRSAIASTSSTRCRPGSIGDLRRHPRAHCRTCRSSRSPCRSSTPTARVAGVAGGSLDLSKFERFVDDFRTLPDAQITVVDQHDRVIYTSGQTGFCRAAEPRARTTLVLAAASSRQRRVPLSAAECRTPGDARGWRRRRDRRRRPAGRCSSSSR